MMMMMMMKTVMITIMMMLMTRTRKTSNPWGKGGSGVLIYAGKGNWRFLSFHACAQWGPPFFGVQVRLDSTRLDCRYQGLVHWVVAAQKIELWKQHVNTFSIFAANEHATYAKFSAVRCTGLTGWLPALFFCFSELLGTAETSGFWTALLDSLPA